MPQNKIGSKNNARYARIAAAAMASAASTMRPDRKSAIDAIQNARNGRSASSDPPFTTNAGAAMNSNVAHSGRSEKRQASRHTGHTAISENAMYRAGNGITFRWPKTSSNAANGQALPGGCEW